MSGVWTTGGCEEESAGAVEVVIFIFLFFYFLFFIFYLYFLFFYFGNENVIRGICGMGMMTFRFFMREGEWLVGAFFSFWGGREKRSCGYIPL